MEMGRRRHVGKDESALGALEWQMETARLRFRHPINPTSPSSVPHTSSLARLVPDSPYDVRCREGHIQARPRTTPARIGREAAARASALCWHLINKVQTIVPVGFAHPMLSRSSPFPYSRAPRCWEMRKRIRGHVFFFFLKYVQIGTRNIFQFSIALENYSH